VSEGPLDPRGQIPGQMDVFEVLADVEKTLSTPAMRRVPPRAPQVSRRREDRQPITVAELVRRKLSRG
jgi:hypothetical protein